MCCPLINIGQTRPTWYQSLSKDYVVSHVLLDHCKNVDLEYPFQYSFAVKQWIGLKQCLSHEEVCKKTFVKSRVSVSRMPRKPSEFSIRSLWFTDSCGLCGCARNTQRLRETELYWKMKIRSWKMQETNAFADIQLQGRCTDEVNKQNSRYI